MSSTISPATDFFSRYRQLKATLGEIGYFRRGTLLKRFMSCGKPDCVCKASPPRLHGPYYQWTRKVEGKTVTVHFKREQADLVEEWIATGRRLDRIIAEMEKLSFQATERLLRELEGSSQKGSATRSRGKRASKSSKR